MEIIEEEYLEENYAPTFMNETEMQFEDGEQDEVVAEKETAIQEENENNDAEVEGTPETPVPRLDSDNTYLIVKTKIKQMLAKKVSEEISKNTEDKMRSIFLQQRNGAILKKKEVSIDNANLQNQIEIDNTLLTQSRNHVLKMCEMLTLMGGSLKKLSKFSEEIASETNQLLEKSKNQRKNSENLTNISEIEIKRAEEEIKNLKKTRLELQAQDEAELESRQKFLKDFKNKFEEVQKYGCYDKIIKKLQTQKSFLAAKLAEEKENQLERHTEKEKELAKATKFLQKLQEEKQSLSDKLRFSLLKTEELEQKSRNDKQELQQLDAEVSNLEQEIEEKKKDLNDRQETQARACEETEEATAISRRHLEDIVADLKEKKAELLARDQEHTKHLLGVKENQEVYIQSSDDHSSCYNNILEQQTLLYESRAAKNAIALEHAEKREKGEKLRKHEEELLKKLNQIDIDISTAKKIFEENSVVKLTKCEELSQTHSQNCDGLKRKKEYASASLAYFTEKSANLQNEFQNQQVLSQKRIDEIADLQPSIAAKEKQLEELQTKIKNIKNEIEMFQRDETELPLKSRLRSPSKSESAVKKVQFNDKILIKSPTESSETLSQSTTQQNKAKGFSQLLELLRSSKRNSNIASTSQLNVSKDL